MFDFDYLIIDTDTDTNTDTYTFKCIMVVFIIISIVLFILLIVRFVPTTKNENENENEKTLEILNNVSMYSNYNFYNVTATFDDLNNIESDNGIVKLYSWILEHDKKKGYFKYDDKLNLPFKSLCEIKIEEKDLDSFNVLKTADLEDNTIYINKDNSTEDNFIEYHNYLVTLFTYIKNNGNINITEKEIRLIWNNDPSYLSSNSILKNINADEQDNYNKFIEIGGRLRDFTIKHIGKINEEENLVVKTSGFSMQSLKNNKFLNLVREIILLIILFIIIIYIWNWIINKMKYFNPKHKDLAIIIMDIMLLIGLFTIIGVKIKEYSENQSKNQGKCK
jgi:flagellar biogenesis protein FliO